MNEDFNILSQRVVFRQIKAQKIYCSKEIDLNHIQSFIKKISNQMFLKLIAKNFTTKEIHLFPFWTISLMKCQTISQSFDNSIKDLVKSIFFFRQKSKRSQKFFLIINNLSKHLICLLYSPRLFILKFQLVLDQLTQTEYKLNRNEKFFRELNRNLIEMKIQNMLEICIKSLKLS